MGVLPPNFEAIKIMSQQLTIFDELDRVSDSGSASLTKSVSDGKRQAIQRFFDKAEKEPIACVNTYSPGGRKAKYYRLSYRLNRKIKHNHIKGGNTSARLARYRAEVLQSMIDRGAELAEILEQLADFNGGKSSMN